jgi:hypothetical protein
MVTITPSPSDRDLRRLKGVHPTLAAAIVAILKDMQAAGQQMFVVMGVRTQAEQEALYAKGRTIPGAIVTNKDGIAHPSNHQPKADGLGYAVDCAFLGTRDPWSLDLPWQLYGEKVEAAGLTWGGRWTHPHDSPHAELPSSAGTKPA